MNLKINSSRSLALASILLISCLIFSYSVPAARAESSSSIKVMTQNMDAGTDLKLVFYYLATEQDLIKGATFTYAELLQNDIPGRAVKLAAEIAAKKPDIISLQEVTLWRTAPSLYSQEWDVLFDQLDLLMDALSARKMSYTVVRINDELSDFAAPMDITMIGLAPNNQLGAIRFTDRDVVLVRSDIKKSHITVEGHDGGTYSAALDLSSLGLPFKVPRGWISVDLKIGDTPVRFFNTHLESTYPDTGLFDVYARGIQAAQAQELAIMGAAAGMPVILAGDFNSNMVENGFENTDTTGILADAGLTEVWGALHPQETGFTWPLYLEDPQGPNPYGPFERIDLIFQTGLEMINIERVIRQSLPFASDHAGVVATLRLQ